MESAETIIDAIQKANPNLSRDAVIAYIKNGIKFYLDQALQHWDTKEKRLGVAHAFHLAIDENINNQSDETKALLMCKKGCAACCHILVDVSKTESELIYEHCKDKGIAIDKDHLEKQKDLDKDGFKGIAGRCVFLAADNSCKIYDFRPGVCRKYYVESDPKYCDVEKYPHYKEVIKLLIMNNEMIFESLVLADNEIYGSLPKMLLKVMENE